MYYKLPCYDPHNYAKVYPTIKWSQLCYSYKLKYFENYEQNIFGKYDLIMITKNNTMIKTIWLYIYLRTALSTFMMTSSSFLFEILTIPGR